MNQVHGWCDVSISHDRTVSDRASLDMHNRHHSPHEHMSHPEEPVFVERVSFPDRWTAESRLLRVRSGYAKVEVQRDSDLSGF